MGHTESTVLENAPRATTSQLQETNRPNNILSTRLRALECPEIQMRHQCQFMAVTSLQTGAAITLRRSTRTRRPPASFPVANFKKGSRIPTISSATTMTFQQSVWAELEKSYLKLPPPVYDPVNNPYPSTTILQPRGTTGFLQGHHDYYATDGWMVWIVRS